MDINKLCDIAHKNAVEKGFYENPKNVGEMLALMHSEISEALEADRKGRYCEVPNIFASTFTHEGDRFWQFYISEVKGTVEEEMADIIIRVADFCGWKKIDIASHIEAKIKFNSMREKYHGKKY